MFNDLTKNIVLYRKIKERRHTITEILYVMNNYYENLSFIILLAYTYCSA